MFSPGQETPVEVTQYENALLQPAALPEEPDKAPVSDNQDNAA